METDPEVAKSLVSLFGPYWTMVGYNVSVFMATTIVGRKVGERFNFKLSSQDEIRVAFLGTAAAAISAAMGLYPVVPIFAGLATGIALASKKS